MKIAQIISHSYPSGASHHVLLLAAALQRRGHVVTLLCPPGGWLPGRARAIGVDVRETRMRSPRYWAEMQDSGRWLREQRADMIHTHTTRGAVQGLLLGLSCRLPVAASVHTYSRDIVYRRLLPRGRNRVVTVSNFVRDALIARGAPASHVQTIYNGTDFLDQPDAAEQGAIHKGATPLTSGPTAETVRVELNVPLDAPLVGVIGYISALKGQALLAQAAPQIIAQCPDTRFVFVGPLASAETQQAILTQAARDGVDGHLLFTGLRFDVARLMDAMDVVAIPSQIESFSMVTLEAMARGKPVVAARVGGIPELVVHGETGLLVDRAPDAFAEAILALLHDPLDRARMGRAGRARVEASFTAARMACQFENLYCRITAPARRR